MNTRLRQLRESHDLLQKDVAEFLGISQSAYSLIEGGTVSLSISHLRALSRRFNVSIDWLVFGEDNARYADQKDFIPLVDVEAQAGYLQYGGNSQFMKSLDLFKIPGFTTGNYRLFEVEGSSMEPTFCHGDHLICTKKNLSDIVDGGVYTIVNSDSVVVKRVFKKDDFYEIVSDNSAYRPYHIDASYISEIWEVNGKVTENISNGFEDSKRLEKLEKEFAEISELFENLLKKLEP